MATTQSQIDGDRCDDVTMPQYTCGRNADDIRSRIIDDVIELYKMKTDVDNPEDYIMTFEGDRLPQSVPAARGRYRSKTVTEMARIKVTHPELRKLNLEVDPDEPGGFNDWAWYQCDMDAEAEGIILSVQKRRYEL